MNRPPYKVILVGLGPTTATALRSLVHHRHIVLTLVRDIEDEMVQLARSLEIPVEADASVTAIERLVDTLAPDAVVVSSYNRILPAALLQRARFVNVHYAPLPKYRGRANVNWAIINHERECAISIHVLAPGLDAGNILYQETFPIGEDDTIGDLYRRLNAAQERVLGETVARHLGGFEGVAQIEEHATYGCTRLPEDGEVDWGQRTREVYALVRALGDPFPGAFTFWGLQRLTIWTAKPVANAPVYIGRVPGRIVRVSKAEGTVDVLTGDGVLRLMQVQLDNGPKLQAASVIKSVKATLGLSTTALLARLSEMSGQLKAVSGSGDTQTVPRLG